MRIRELYDRYFSPSDRLVADQYEAAIKVWEQLTTDPPVGRVTFDDVESFRQRCRSDIKLGESSEGCWRFLQSILIAADRQGVIIPYFRLSN